MTGVNKLPIELYNTLTFDKLDRALTETDPLDHTTMHSYCLDR